MEKQLSIIIPTYNAAGSIKRCLSSVDTQLEGKNYEVIVVDDGSSDETAEIVLSYIRDKENFHFIGQENKGAGTARNRGIEAASGKYLLFVDSDDYLNDGALNKIDKELKADDLDILIFCYQYYDDSTSALQSMYYRDSYVYLNKKIKNRVFNFREYPSLHECIAYPWNKVFKKSLLDDNNIRCSGTRVHNDIFINIASIVKAKKIKVITDLLYVHVINSQGEQLTRLFDDRRLDVFQVFKECEDFMDKEGLEENLKFSYYFFKADLLEWIIVRTDGGLQDVFLNYTDSFLQSLPHSTVIHIMSHRLKKLSRSNVAKVALLTQAGRFLIRTKVARTYLKKSH